MTADPPNLDELARRYLDLWQDQVAAMSADPDMSRTMGRYAQLWATLGPAGLAGIWAAAAEGLKGGGPGANVFAVTSDGDTPLHQAAFGNHVECALALLNPLQPDERVR